MISGPYFINVFHSTDAYNTKHIIYSWESNAFVHLKSLDQYDLIDIRTRVEDAGYTSGKQTMGNEFRCTREQVILGSGGPNDQTLLINRLTTSKNIA